MTLRNGVIVLEYMDPARVRPYQLWNADMATCERCGMQVIFRFADKPFAQHFENDFEDSLRQARESGKLVAKVY
jgi:hypothetical protein